MKKQLIDLTYRRRLLLEKINNQRREVAEISLQLQKPLKLVDTGIKAKYVIRSHLTLVIGSLALLLALRRGNLRLMALEGGRLFCQYLAKI